MKECALGVIYSKSGDQVLLVKRRDVPVWVLPGGGIDEGETPEAAALREVFEETGLAVTIRRKLAEYTPINRFTSRTHLFECEALSESVKITNETQQVGFYSFNALPDPLFPYHAEWLEAARANPLLSRCQPMSRTTFRRILWHCLKRPIFCFRYLAAKWGFPINSCPKS